MAEHGGLWGVARDVADLPREHPPQHGVELAHRHRLFQAIAHRLPHQRMIGDLAVAADVLQARSRLRERRGHQVVGLHALQRGRHLAAHPVAQHGQRDGGVPAPAGREHRRIDQRLHQRPFERVRVHVAEDVLQREGMLGPEREQHPLLGGRRLQLEVELAAELLAQREPPRPVHARSEGRMQDHLHPPGLVEEAFEHQRVLRGQGPEDVLRLPQVMLDLARCGGRQPELLQPPRSRVLVLPIQARLHVGAQAGHRARQLRAPPRSLSQPERDRRGLPVRVRHSHGPGIDGEDAPGGVPQLEDVARRTLDGEVLVERADEGLLRIEHHPVVGVVGDGASRRDRREAGRATPLDAPVDPVAVHERPAPPAPGDEALGDHLHHLVEVLARQLPVRVRAAPEAEELILGPGFARRLGHRLLRQHVERLRHHHEPVQLSVVHGPHQRRALDQIVAREREQAAPGGAAHGVPGPPHPLQEGRDPARRADLAHQVDVPDVDAELERRRRHQRLQRARAKPVLGRQSRLLGEAAVVRGDRLLPQPVGQPGREAFRHPARVDEDEGGPVSLDRLGQALVDLRPHLVRHHRFHGRGRHLDGEVHGAPVAFVDDGAAGLEGEPRRGIRRARRSMSRFRIRAPARVRGSARILGPARIRPPARFEAPTHIRAPARVPALAPQQKARDLADRLLGGRQPDALQRPAHDVPQPLQAERQVRSPARIDHGMDFVHDHRAHGAEHRPAALGGQEQVERLRGGDQDVRGRAQHRGAARRGRVPGAHRGTDADGGQPRLHGPLADGGERLLEVLVDVGAERLEGRDVEDPHLVLETMLEPFAQQLVDGVQEGGQRLPGPGRGREQGVPALADGGPGALLGGERRPQGPGEPVGDNRMEGQAHPFFCPPSEREATRWRRTFAGPNRGSTHRRQGRSANRNADVRHRQLTLRLPQVRSRNTREDR